MRIARILGADLVCDNLFLVFLALSAFVGLLPESLILVGSVILHETAHAAAASTYGLRLKSMELTPFGGVARFDGPIETRPACELSMALAGPLSSLVLSLIAWLLLREGVISGSYGRFLLEANLMLGLFNLMPALPLDGGRVYRSYLAMRIGLREATRRAVLLGMGLALGLFILGAVGALVGWINPLSSALGLFLFRAALEERRASIYVFMRYLSRKREEIRSRGVLRAQAVVALEEATLGAILREFVPQRYHLVFVINNEGRVIGVITEDDIIDSILDKGMGTRISSLLLRR